MITQNLINQIKEDEGVVYEIYNDHLGYATFGVGHLIKDSDPEKHLEIGSKVTKERVDSCLVDDLQTAADECKILYPWFMSAPQEVKEILINMMFNMGRPRLTKFVNFNKAIMRKDWKSAAVEGRDSLWHRQVTKRAERLMKRLESL